MSIAAIVPGHDPRVEQCAHPIGCLHCGRETPELKRCGDHLGDLRAALRPS